MAGRTGNQHQRRKTKKAARRKAVLNDKHGQAVSSHSALAQAKLAATRFGVSHCMITEALFEQGLGYVILGREKPSTTVALAFFLVDVNCLGVKNAFYAEMSHREFMGRVEGLMMSDFPLVDIDPPCARQVLAGAIAYARELGFSPHRDYAEAVALFGDIDACTCSTAYEFGKDGKPFYFAGPNETPSKVRRILRSLTDKVGEGNFSYLTQADFF